MEVLIIDSLQKQKKSTVCDGSAVFVCVFDAMLVNTLPQEG